MADDKHPEVQPPRIAADHDALSPLPQPSDVRHVYIEKGLGISRHARDLRKRHLSR